MKKFLACVITLVLMLTMAIPAFAASVGFSFTVNRGGASVATAQVKKDDTAAAWISGLSSPNISSSNQCSFRVRKAVDDSSCSALYNQSNTNSFNIYYLSGTAIRNEYYKLWASAPSGNSLSNVQISGTFAP